MKGYIHSIQSLGALDGPGIRFVTFFQGCNLRCGFCHNPDTWERNNGTEMSAEEIVQKAQNYREYFGKKGGITLSGGEPLLQAEFAREIFQLAKEVGINTCLDTSGSILTEEVKKLLSVTDRVLLDIKFKSDEEYKQYVGCSNATPLAFLSYLNEQKIPTTLRHVIVKGINDDEESIRYIKGLRDSHECVDKVELLGFKKICKVKYDNLKIPFPFDVYDTPTKEEMERYNELLRNEE